MPTQRDRTSYDNPGKRLYIHTFGCPYAQVPTDDSGAFKEIKYL